MLNKIIQQFILIAGLQIIALNLTGQDLSQCSARLESDRLILENSMMRREYQWNKGSLISTRVTDKVSNNSWELNGNEPDFTIPGPTESSSGHFETIEVAKTNYIEGYLKAIVYATYGQLHTKREFRIFPDCPAIACDFFVKGIPDTSWQVMKPNVHTLRNYESHGYYTGKEKLTEPLRPRLDRLCLPGDHWRLTAVEFFEVSDNKNTYLQEHSILAYISFHNRLKGNLLFMDHLTKNQGLFFLKESPSSNVQLAYPGYDFYCMTFDMQVVGLGIEPTEILPDEWRKCYGVVTGVTDGSELGKMSALRSYKMKNRIHDPKRDDMILMNTWGDRNKGAKLNEAFCIAELEAGHRLGITHFQIDDGWQKTIEAGHPDLFHVVEDKFPNGLQPVVDKGKELGIEVSLWVDPGRDYTYSHWSYFADRLIDLNREYGIRTFKLDGIVFAEKETEIRMRQTMDKVKQALDADVVFNIDLTAGKRCGYNYFTEYGNYYVENRYTDWRRYFPHWTLRNLWMLSRYVPPQQLQMSFLNKWRNADKYDPEDPLAPSKISFEYIFAVTMMAQPLAFFEGTGLPEEAFKIASMIQTYRKHMGAIHTGQIFPIGDEPSGTSWTGFQTIKTNQTGYVLVFREYNHQKNDNMKTLFKRGKKVKFTSILGQGKDFKSTVQENGEVCFKLPKEHSFALYAYQID